MGITTALTIQWVVFFANSKHIKMNKFLAISCMAVAAMAAPEAEADPYLLYGGYGGYGLGGYGYPYGLGYGYAHAAVAPVAAGYASVSPSASVSIAGLAGAAVPAVAGGYAAAGRYVANSAGVVHVAKREAEADAEADPYYAYGYHGLGYAGYHGLGYAGYAGYPYAGLGYNYGLGYGHYAHAVAAPAVAAPVVAAAAPVAVKAAPVAVAAPLVHHAVAAGYADVSPSNAVNIAGLAPAAIPAVGGAYAGAGRYCANSAGVIHCA